jgi:hypothetical protein
MGSDRRFSMIESSLLEHTEREFRLDRILDQTGYLDSIKNHDPTLAELVSLRSAVTSRIHNHIRNSRSVDIDLTSFEDEEEPTSVIRKKK